MSKNVLGSGAAANADPNLNSVIWVDHEFRLEAHSWMVQNELAFEGSIVVAL